MALVSRGKAKKGFSGSTDQGKIDVLVDDLNRRLKLRGVRGRIVVVKNNFYLRGTFPDSRGMKAQRRIALHLPAVENSVLTAETRLVELSEIINRTGKIPAVLPWDAPPVEVTDGATTIADAIALVEVDFWKGKDEGNLQSQRSWERMQAVYKKLPQRADLNINLLVDWISRETAPETSGRKKACQYFKRLAVKNRIVGTEAIDELVGDYKPKQRKSFDDEALIQLIEFVRADDTRMRKRGWQPYGWLTAAMFCFGTRPSETFSLIPSEDGTAKAVNLPKAKKPHWKFPICLPQKYLEEWDLMNIERPFTFNLDNYDPQETKYQARQWLKYLQGQIKKMGIECLEDLVLMDIRHSWGIRSIHSDLDPRSACKSLGHDLATHYRTYTSTYDLADAKKAAAKLRN